ncbi:hypothetical protein [Streptosporangium roseum]|uniref:hypothetical protein n=1 Tax=Streptosporangium roseum TaxID=2001 RepID=UPI00331CB9DE
MNSPGVRADPPLSGGRILTGLLTEHGLIDDYQIFVHPSGHGRWEPATESCRVSVFVTS